MVRSSPLAIVLSLLFSFSAVAEEGNSTCLECHARDDLEAVTERGKKLKRKVRDDALRGSVHEDLLCTSCHTGAATWDEVPHNGGKPVEISCKECHAEAYEEAQKCVHGQAMREGVAQAPTCQSCHGGHAIVPLASPESSLSHHNQPATCGKCHQSDTLDDKGGISKRKLIERYYSSVHWQSVKEGKPAASCVDCHGKHCILPSSQEGSTVSRVGLLTACAKCHASIVEVYSKGSHGRTLLHGNLDVPTCTTCHGDHDMMSLKTQAGGTRNFAGTQICIWCHGNERMMARYALDISPVESYMRDFHGLTQRGTAGTSATCSDCHEAHHSLPSSHPESRMHISNRGAACGKCHGQTSDTFIMSFTHRTKAVDQGGDIKRIITIVYVVLILGIIGAMLLHNFIIWWHAYRRKRRYQEAHAKIVRLNRFERSWHWVLFLSFTLLVVTGFALKFPDTSVFQWLFGLGMTEAVRAMLHRLAALAMTADMLIFVAYQLATRPGRRWLGPMLPRVQDVREMFQTLLYYLGRRSEKPLYGVFNYAEKAEYWALLWGALLMLLTGLVLWFPKSLPETWPAWVIEVARTIHYLEAVLASLAILVWHFFHTIFHPAEYPMDTSWLTGVLTEQEAYHRFHEGAIRAQSPPLAAPEPEPEPPARPEWSHETVSEKHPQADRGQKESAIKPENTNKPES